MNNEHVSELNWYLQNEPHSYGKMIAVLEKAKSRNSSSPFTVSPLPVETPSQPSSIPSGVGFDVDGDGDVDEDDLKTLFPPADYGKRKNWIGWAKDAKSQKRRGRYHSNGGMPSGLVVHFDAGHPDATFSRMENQAAGGSYSYMILTEDGTLGQANPLNQYGYHAGKSEWNGKSVVHKYFSGVEIACPGKLKDNGDGTASPWFERKFPLSKCRKVASKDNIQGGLYYMFTEAQEEVLIALCLWMKWNDPKGFSFDNVVGHDEVSPNRKSDPGGSLSMTMPDFRKHLKELWEQIKP